MRALAFVAVVVLSMAVVLGGVLLLLPYLRGDDPGPIILATSATTLMVLGAVLAGAFAQWLPQDPERRRVQFRRMILIGGGVQALGVIAMAICAGLVGAPPWVILAVAAGGVILTAACYWLGRAFRSPSAPLTDAQLAESGLDADLPRRMLRTQGIVVAGVSVVVCGAILGFEAAFGVLDAEEIARAALMALGAGCIAASFVGLGPMFRITGALRALSGDDSASARRIGQVVLGKKQHHLDEEGERRAVRFAVLMRLYLPVQGLQSATLLVGLLLSQAPNVFFGDGGFRAFTIGIAVFLVVGLAVTVPLGIRQYRRVSAYAQAHGGRLTAA